MSYVQNADGVFVPADDAAAATTTAATPTITGQPQIGAWTTIDRAIPASIDWTQFDYGNHQNYSDVLKSSYKTAVSGIGFINQPKKAPVTYDPVNFKDDKWDTILGDVYKQLDPLLYDSKPNYVTGLGGLGTPTRALKKDAYYDSYYNPTDKTYKAPDIGNTGLSLLEAANASYRDPLLQQFAALNGVTVEDILKHDTSRQRAMNAYYNPVTSNWQDVMASPFYQDALTGIDKFTNRKDTDPRWQAFQDASKNNVLAPEYYALHDRPAGTAKLTTAGPRRSNTAGLGANYRYTDWSDFLPSGVAARDATPEQYIEAQKAQEAQRVLTQPWLDPNRYTPEKIAEISDRQGGMGSTYDLKYSENVPLPKGMKYRPSADMKLYNMAVNAGVDPTTLTNAAGVGLDPNKVIKGSFKKKKSVMNSPILNMAKMALAVVQPELAPYIMAANSAQSAINGDIFGAVLSGVGAYGGFTGSDMLGGASDSISNSVFGALRDSGLNLTTEQMSSIASGLGKSVVQGGLGGINAAVHGGDAFMGALTAGGGTLLSSTLNDSLKSTIPDPKLRNFIVQSATTATMQNLASGTKPRLYPNSSTTSTGVTPTEGTSKQVGSRKFNYNNGIWIPA
jgi:hypothetical protein